MDATRASLSLWDALIDVVVAWFVLGGRGAGGYGNLVDIDGIGG